MGRVHGWPARVFLCPAQRAHWSAAVLNEAPLKRADSSARRAAGSDRDTATRPPVELLLLLRGGWSDTGYLSTKGGLALCRSSVSEIE